MSVVREIRARLEHLEAQVAPELRDEVRTLRLLLADPERQWIGTVEAQRLLGVQSINTVKAWARLGLLRSRRGPSGRLKVHLDDVLREARAQRELAASGEGDDPVQVNEEIRRVRRQLRDPAARARVDEALAAAGMGFEQDGEPA
jgi:hypothetical protein